MKDSYYFPHDSNAAGDPKCIVLIEELGLEGYGIFWVLIEHLRDQPEYRAPIRIIPALARRYNTTEGKMNAVINRYDLFQVEEDQFFYSASLRSRMERVDARRKALSEAGQRGNAKRWGSGGDRVAIAEQSHQSKSKQIIPKQSRSFTAPTLDEVKEYAKEREMSSEDANKFFDYHTSKGWIVGNRQMKDWKAALRYWQSNTPLFQPAKKTTVVESSTMTYKEMIAIMSKEGLTTDAFEVAYKDDNGKPRWKRR